MTSIFLKEHEIYKAGMFILYKVASRYMKQVA